MDLRDQLLRERSRADHQDPLAVGCRLHEGQDARPQHESEPEGDGRASEQLDRRDCAMAERGVDGRRQQRSGGDGLRQPRHRIAEAPDPAEVVEVVIGGDGNADEGDRETVYDRRDGAGPLRSGQGERREDRADDDCCVHEGQDHRHEDRRGFWSRCLELRPPPVSRRERSW